MRQSRFKIGKLVCDEHGGAYTLSYVMVIPVLVLLICVTIETTMMMSAKVGTVYAAYSGARTASVWASATENWSAVEQKVTDAATQSFVPFASGMGRSTDAPANANEYSKSYESFVDQAAAKKYVTAKYANAADRLSVSIDGRPTRHDSNLTVTVEYRFRFNLPGIGRLLGQKDNDGYSFPLSSKAVLQNEGPKNLTQDLGIGYGKF